VVLCLLPPTSTHIACYSIRNHDAGLAWWHACVLQPYPKFTAFARGARSATVSTRRHTYIDIWTVQSRFFALSSCDLRTYKLYLVLKCSISSLYKKAMPLSPHATGWGHLL
jgi:hypothetical protein